MTAPDFDGRAWLADAFVSSATGRADAVYLCLGGFLADDYKTLTDVENFVYARGLVSLEAWASTMASLGTDGEAWAREAANDFAGAYKARIETLFATAAMGGAT